MDAVTLRKLSRKSVLWFGKHKDRTVQQVIDLKNFRALRWYYFNLSGVSFLDDVLDEIGITEEYRIEKPGKDPEKGEMLNAMKDCNAAKFAHAAYENGNGAALGKFIKQRKKEQKLKKGQLAEYERNDKKKFSKGNLQQVNHGHKSL